MWNFVKNGFCTGKLSYNLFNSVTINIRFLELLPYKFSTVRLLGRNA